RSEPVIARTASGRVEAARTSQHRTWNGFRRRDQESRSVTSPLIARPIPAPFTPIFAPAIPASVNPRLSGRPWRGAATTGPRPPAARARRGPRGRPPGTSGGTSRRSPRSRPSRRGRGPARSPAGSPPSGGTRAAPSAVRPRYEGLLERDPHGLLRESEGLVDV